MKDNANLDFSEVFAMMFASSEGNKQFNFQSDNEMDSLSPFKVR